jgi:hypothetical protein
VHVPGYELLEQVGEGGRGTVYRARQLSLDRTVAVKVLRADVPEQGQDAAFEREGRLMASLAHPNLVTIYDAGQVNGQNYLVTEYVPGSTLRSRMKPGQPWRLREASPMLDSIARALSYIHQRAVLHLDLKPENILFTPGGAIKIADFGLGLARVDARELSALGMAQGTFDYCSPEQRFGLPTDERSDLFSFGVVVYELLTGHLPGRVYQSARRLNPGLPLSLDQVLSKALARDPNERYASVEEFRRDLSAHLTKRDRRTRWLLVLACGMLLLFVAMLFWYGRDVTRPADATPTDYQSWLLVDESEAATQQAPAADGPAALIVSGLAPQGGDQPQLPTWPEPRPALVMSSPGALGFVHFLEDAARPKITPAEWDFIVHLPPLAPENNLIQAGTFEGDCLTAAMRSSTPFWRNASGGLQSKTDSVTIATPADRPNNPALLFHRRDPLTAGREMTCYQWVARGPEQSRALVVLRYRARAEDGTSRLKVVARMPLFIRHAADDAVAQRLRSLSEPLAGLNPPPGVEARVCTLRDWVRPDGQWRTYCVIWEWPSCSTDSGFRNIEIVQAGLGKVWLDDLELFTLPKRANP